MLGKDLTEDFAGRREAQKRVQRSKLVFTTCVGAALGLLRSEKFDIVIVDEASQQTVPATMIPLTKGCRRAILVGDHLQLRATVQKHAVVSDFDISLFEKLYTDPDVTGVAKAMLDTQYRMHQDICQFSSDEFYDGRLHTAPDVANIALPSSRFSWPASGRRVFVSCKTSEDLGRQSKSNQGQVQACKAICKLLTSPALDSDASKGASTQADDSASLTREIVILTPYTRQRELLQSALPAFRVSSIDGFQGREARIVVFVTVRCNSSYHIGFLKDLRRLNVVMTRAKAGIVVIGDKATLIGHGDDEDDTTSKDVWKRLLNQCHELQIVPSMT